MNGRSNDDNSIMFDTNGQQHLSIIDYLVSFTVYDKGNQLFNYILVVLACSLCN